jgi:hypothetical protein
MPNTPAMIARSAGSMTAKAAAVRHPAVMAVVRAPGRAVHPVATSPVGRVRKGTVVRVQADLVVLVGRAAISAAMTVVATGVTVPNGARPRSRCQRS